MDKSLIPEEAVKGLIIETLKARNIDIEDLEIEKLLTIAPEGKGDYAFPCFKLASIVKKKPVDIAKDLEKEILELRKKWPIIRNIKAENAYLNFFIDWDKVFRSVLLKEKNLPLPNLGDGKKILVEYSSPNANKPMHLGHLRNNALGESVSRLLESIGYKVVRTNLLNDRGLSVFQALLAYMLYGNDTTPETTGEKPDHFVGRFYVLYKEKEKEQPELEEEARKLLKRWENNDPQVRKLWERFVGWALQGFMETYEELGIRFDRIDYESQIYDKGKEIVRRAVEKGIFQKGEEGEIIAPLEKHALPNKVVLRSDETSLYITQDIYLAIKRYNEEKFYKLIYVVASEQDLHFKQLFTILNLLGHEWAQRLEHLSYGLVLLEGGKMKSREGRVVDADDIIQEMIDLALREINKRNPELGEKEKLERARKIGIGALNFYLLKFDPRKDFLYKPEEGISFEGETGPYLQYTYARLRSIIRKSGIDPLRIKINGSLGGEEEKIVKNLWLLRKTIIDSALRNDPSILAHELIHLAQLINNYYHSTPILKSREKEKRLLLIYIASNILAMAMKLLVMETLEEM
ncbi:arginine--tRNA ligase [Candidatus Woesearchaeota archaeon]|nr:arginine--tRNA ligase [Candidatus Woesearchaeota archaeon]